MFHVPLRFPSHIALSDFSLRLPHQISNSDFLSQISLSDCPLRYLTQTSSLRLRLVTRTRCRCCWLRHQKADPSSTSSHRWSSWSSLLWWSWSSLLWSWLARWWISSRYYMWYPLIRLGVGGMMVTTSQLPQNSQRLEEVTFECQSLSLACQPLAVSSLLHTHSSRSHPVVRLNIILSNASSPQNENDDDDENKPKRKNITDSSVGWPSSLLTSGISAEKTIYDK